MFFLQYSYFNSHARVGRDDKIAIVNQSIENFNSHARVGRDWVEMEEGDAYIDFNSHARVGRDASLLRFSATLSFDFNSHARVGRDSRQGAQIMSGTISTHTPV